MVGIDFCNFEPGHPISKQILAAEQMIEAVGQYGGIRIHAGEGVEHSVEITAALLTAEIFLPRCRLGHGVGFAGHLAFRDHLEGKHVMKDLERLIAKGGPLRST